MSAAHGPREHADSPRTRASPTTLPRSQAVRRLREFDLVLVLETAAECDAAMKGTVGMAAMSDFGEMRTLKIVHFVAIAFLGPKTRKHD